MTTKNVIKTKFRSCFWLNIRYRPEMNVKIVRNCLFMFKTKKQIENLA